MVKVNFDEVPDRMLIAEGPHVVTVDKVFDKDEDGDDIVTQNDDYMWRLYLKIEDENDPDDGRMLFDNFVFSESALPRVKMALKALGFETEGEKEVTPKDIVGKNCIVFVEHTEDNQGKDRETIAFQGYKEWDGDSPYPDRDEEEETPDMF